MHCCILSGKTWFISIKSFIEQFYCIIVHEEDEMLKDEYAQDYKVLQGQNQGYQPSHQEKKKQKVNKTILVFKISPNSGANVSNRHIYAWIHSPNAAH